MILWTILINFFLLTSLATDYIDKLPHTPLFLSYSHFTLLTLTHWCNFHFTSLHFFWLSHISCYLNSGHIFVTFLSYHLIVTKMVWRRCILKHSLSPSYLTKQNWLKCSRWPALLCWSWVVTPSQIWWQQKWFKACAYCSTVMNRGKYNIIYLSK